MFDLKSIVIGIVLMLRKYTCINLTIYEEANEEDYKNGIMALPLIGLAIGFVAFVIGAFRHIYDAFLISSLILLYYGIISKTTNIKDLYRTLNYYIKPANQTDQVPGIMGIILVCLMYFSLFRLVPASSLLIMPLVGFSNLIILSKVIKRDLDKTSILKYCDSHHIIIAFAISYIAAIIFNYKLVISLSLTYMLMAMIVSIGDKKISNIPSSVEGFIIEVSQVIFLLITYLLKL